MTVSVSTYDTGVLNIGIIGYGSIGRQLHKTLAESLPNAQYTILTRSEPAAELKKQRRTSMVQSVDALIASKPAVVAEVAGQKAVRDYAGPILQAGIPVLVASVGSFADADIFSKCMQAAIAGGTSILVPSGAVGGLDYIGAIGADPEAKVEYTSRKPVSAWVGELMERGIDAASLASEHVLFEGDAATAARVYPQNLNVAATIALAAAGMDKIRVRVIADPAVIENTHEIQIASRFGSASMRFSNKPSASNPKTSAVTAASVAHTILQTVATVKI